VQNGRFRDDLFFRLAVARIELPPLRARAGDVALLGRHFWRMQGGADTPLPADLMTRFADYDWPGNVRELYNTVARRLALGELAYDEDQQPAIREAPGAPAIPVALDVPFSQARQRAIDAFERCYVEHVLARHGGSVVRAAAASGIARRYFHILKSKHGAK